MMMTETEVCSNQLFTPPTISIENENKTVDTDTTDSPKPDLDIHVITEPAIVAAESPIAAADTTTTSPSTTPPSVTSPLAHIPMPSFFGDHQIKSLTCKSNNLNLTFNIHVENESLATSQRCFIMSIHEITRDYTRYQEFINCQQMADVRSRTVWIHVDLPGLQTDAADLKIRKYPSMTELAEELVCVVDYLKVPQIICMGDGHGANVATYFALKHPKRCLGLVLIEPASFTPGFLDTLRYSMNSVMSMPKTGGQQSNDKSNFIMKRLEKRGSSNDSENEALQQSLNKIHLENHNAYNLAMFHESFYNRQSLNDSLKDLKVDVMLAVGQKSAGANDAKKFYKSLQEVRRKNIKQMVNSPFIQLEGVSDVLEEAPERLACSFQYFLQGIGLLSAIPMRNILRSMSTSSSPANSTGYGRSDSIESSEPTNSQSESQSHSASSSQSLNVKFE